MTHYEDALTAIHSDLLERNDELEDKILDCLAMILAELRLMRAHGLETYQQRDLG